MSGELTAQDGIDYLSDANIPLYPPIVLNPKIMELSRRKSMELCRLAASGVDIATEYPAAYEEMLADLWDFVDDFDAYIDHVRWVILELAELSQKAEDRQLERHEYTPFYGRAKFRSALSVFARDPEKYVEVVNLIAQYKMMTQTVAKIGKPGSTPDHDDDEDLEIL